MKPTTLSGRFDEVVYLDSSDLSRFADVEHGRQKCQLDRELYEAAIAAAASGRVVFPLSMVHLGEAL